SCIVSQLTFSLGGSIFKGANGSMMIEAVPFFHIIVNQIVAGVGDKVGVEASRTLTPGPCDRRDYDGRVCV
ncbi:hypothetical protein Q0M25_13790, partial [Staphylococcus aureus]|nr:hypothetical protein [Staphylococcus aureus]